MGSKSRGKDCQIRLLNAHTKDSQLFRGSFPPFVALCQNSIDCRSDASPLRDETLETAIRFGIDAACRKALEHNIHWLLPVSSELRQCLDKVPPVFQWHQEARFTIVYLHDLSATATDDGGSWRTCEWFSNPWALPALLGSRSLKYYDRDWNEQNDATAQFISSLTKIPATSLLNPSGVSQIPVARMFFWASRLVSQPLEERVRALMTICNPPYSKTRRQRRGTFSEFQLDLLRYRLQDLSLLAWESEDQNPSHVVLADSISDFSRVGRIYTEENSLPLSVRDGFLVLGGDLDVSAMCCHCEDGTLLMELYGRKQPGSVGAREGVYVQLKRVDGTYMRVHPYIFRQPPLASVPSRMRIRLRTAIADQDHLTSSDIELEDTTRASTPQFPFSHSRPATTVPSKYCHSYVASPRGSVMGRTPLKRTWEGYWASIEDGGRSEAPRRTRDSRAVVDEEAPESKRSRRDEIELQPQCSVPAFEAVVTQEPQKLQSYEVSVASDHDAAEDEGDFSLLDGAEEESFDREDFEIFNEVVWDDDELPEDHEFYPARATIIEKGWAGFLLSESQVPPASVLETTAATEHIDGYMSEKEAAEGDEASGTSRDVGLSNDIIGKKFACPFYASDLSKFKRCLRDGGFDDIRAVKMHLARRHRLPPRCPRCFETFGTEAAKKLHLVSVDCQVKDHQPEPPGVSDHHLPKLYRRLLEKKSEEQRWYYIYEILLPAASGHDDLVLPYLEGPLGDTILRLQNFWGRKGPHIISDVLRERELLDYRVKDEERSLRLMFCDVEYQLRARIIERHEKAAWSLACRLGG